MIAEERFCFDTSNHAVGLENLIKNGGVDNEIFGRIHIVGMGGIGNITHRNCSFSFKTSFRSPFKEYCSNLIYQGATRTSRDMMCFTTHGKRETSKNRHKLSMERKS
ncbi:Hypothetical predicted protein [Olea europaea subsp. europaea]|uniref:Uncharacterized protein n=1 Tax=Olea europaea subsp. europaea TaxID=158383 RepID=A0A8S0QYW4_OLEEU|nr:Hypothetical predicted protein [Olea europaea subsp. europaea]